MPDLPFITSNPAIDEYNRANKVASDEENAQLEQQGKVLSNKTAAFNLDTAQTQAPLKLRELTANTGIAETNAQYAGPKAKAEIARSGAETANAYSEIDNRRAQHHMEVFTKSLDLANSGDIASAKALAAQDGQQIAPGVLENAQVRAGLTQLTQRAQQLYPNRPKDQMVWLHSHISTLAQAAQSGQAVDPTAAFTQLPGDPEPQEVGGQGKTGETMQIIQSLMQPTPQNPQGMTFEQAVAAAHGHADEADLRRETLALNAAKADRAYSSDPNGTLASWRAKYGLQPWPGAQGAAPQQPPGVPPGSAYSPSRKMWRDPQGNLYDANGQPVAAPGPQAQAVPSPSVPLSQ